MNAPTFPRVDTMRRRLKMRVMAASERGRAQLQAMLDTQHSALASLDKLRTLGASHPHDSRDRETLRRNIAAIERALGRLAA
jgi:hypothetical protein